MAATAYGHHASHSQSHRGPIAHPNAPAGTFPPGTHITVGHHSCTIERYLSEGGFAHVYLVRLAHNEGRLDKAVLKRVVVPDKEALAGPRTEVETMKRLTGHKRVVTYIDSHASHLKGGGYEVFLLMEYCSGGGLIDFMNTRLQHRLTEPEILHIFGDVCEGVSCMHYLQPPLLHRDLKVENVLLSRHGGGYKLCDFGSASEVKPAPSTVTECRLLDEDIQKHTTLQYRSPEMVDVFRRLPIDEKSDIWALGVLLYKLCYYTTPFEVQGQLAILNASFSYPDHPAFSDRLKNLIASMLKEHPSKRPNIYQVVKEVCRMRGREVPIKDIYSGQVQQVAPREKQLPSLPIHSPPPGIALQSPPPPQQQAIPDVAPMRRGRPGKSSTPQPQQPHSAATSRTRAGGTSPYIRPATTDPFAALDQKPTRQAQDELESRFPSLEQFSLLHDSSGKFQFGSEGGSPALSPALDTPRSGEAERLAEDLFSPMSAHSVSPDIRPARPASALPHGYSATRPNGTVRPNLYEPPPPPQPKRPVMVSTGTMTSPTTSSPSSSTAAKFSSSPKKHELIDIPSSHHDPASDPVVSGSRVRQQHQPQLPTLLDVGPSAMPMSRGPSNSSRPSLESSRSQSAVEVKPDNMVHRSKSANARRPHSVYVESNLEFLRDLDSPSTTNGPPTGSLPSAGLQPQFSGASGVSENIDSDMGFLRAMEAENDTKAEKRNSASSSNFVSKHVKRASMPTISLPGTKGLLSGKFGEAFKKFEKGNHHVADPARTPSPSSAERTTPPISERKSIDLLDRVDDDADDDWQVSSEEVPPEIRRELEKRQLAAEEKRVAQAAADYKRQLASRPPAGDSSIAAAAAPTRGTGRTRANSIQKRVKALLNENKEPAPKTAEGYGRYTADVPQPTSPIKIHRSRPSTATSPTSPTKTFSVSPSKTRGIVASPPQAQGSALPPRPVYVQPQNQQPQTAAKGAPCPPPKPKNLRTGGGGGGGVGAMAAKWETGGVAGGVAEEDLVPMGREAAAGMDPEEWERSFAKRYPSLSGLEMVEARVSEDEMAGGKVV